MHQHGVYHEINFDPKRIQAALTSVYHEFVYLTAATTPRTLIAALSQELPHISPSSWPQRLSRGGTYVNGQVICSDMLLPPPCRIEYYEPRVDDDATLLAYAARIHAHVVFEDEELLVVYKPAGVSSMPTREQRTLNLKSFLEAYLKNQNPGASLHMPSRVDTSVEGLVVTSKHVRMHAALQRVFERRAIIKAYALLTDRALDWDVLEATSAIDRDSRHPILRKSVTHGGKPSHTVFLRISETDKEYTLIAARPITGRTHQIRVHAASYGFPIVGDNFYGGAIAPRLHLVSAYAEFRHPHSGKMLQIEAPPHLRPKWVSDSFCDRIRTYPEGRADITL